jgi:RNA polymerase sigma-70 factor (ECF subfamily)
MDQAVNPEGKPTSFESAIEQEVVRLYQEHAGLLSRYAASFAQNTDGARDAVQEVFMRYFIERRYGRQIGNPRAWLYHVMRNYLLDRQRTINRREVISDDLDRMPGGHQNPEGMLHRSELARELTALLSEREMDCLRLRAEGLEYAEIAELLGIQIGTVGALLSRAQKKIRRSASNNQANTLGAAEAIHFLFDKQEAYS